MKNKILALFILSMSMIANAQTSEEKTAVLQLPKIEISEGVNLLFISPEPIQFVDLSTNELIGDLPSKNIVRVRIKNYDDNKIKEFLKLANGNISKGVITIVGQSFMAQYQTVYKKLDESSPITNVQIQPEHMQPLEYPKIAYSTYELSQFCNDIYKLRIDKDLRDEDDYGLEMTLKNVYVLEDYIFLDLGIENETNIKVDIEDIKFSIEDKSIYSATHHQSVELKPIFQYHHNKKFRKKYRNIFVFRKFTFPNGKVLKIRFLENPISGRTLEMKVKYSDILNADTF